MRSVEERVASGVKWLDENVIGWERLITIKSLNLQHGCNCVIGQVVNSVPADIEENPYGYDFGDVVMDPEWDNISEVKRSLPKALRPVVMTTMQAINRGFDISDPDAEDYADLTREWRKVIKKRRAA